MKRDSLRRKIPKRTTKHRRCILRSGKFGAVDWGLMEQGMNYNDETESWNYYNYETNEWSEEPIYKLPWVVDLRAGYT